MIGVAFLNEMLFWTVGAVIGWVLGRKFEKVRQWAVSKGYIKGGVK